MMKGSVWHYENTDVTWDHEADAKKIRHMIEWHGLSADQIGRIIGTSGLSVYNWGEGKIAPKVGFVGRLRGLHHALDRAGKWNL